MAVLSLSNGAVSTSGNVEQHLDVDGRRYSHVIDPASATGLLDETEAQPQPTPGLSGYGWRHDHVRKLRIDDRQRKRAHGMR